MIVTTPSRVSFVGFLIILLQCWCWHRADARLEIIGSGFGRTGTDSLRMALNMLGYHTYHMKEIIDHNMADHLDVWSYQVDHDCNGPLSKEKFDYVFASRNYTAVIGISTVCYEQLMKFYPEAKVIHTERSSPELWHDSVTSTICAMHGNPMLKVVSVVSPLFRNLRKLVPKIFSKEMIGGELVEISEEFCMENRDKMIDFYNNHNAKVRRVVSEDRLLVITNHRGGWEPICEFLGKPVPDVPFPRVNSRAEFKKLVSAKINKFLVVLSIVGGFVCAIAVFFTTKVDDTTKKNE